LLVGQQQLYTLYSLEASTYNKGCGVNWPRTLCALIRSNPC
jgi:hypothetical protein